MINRCVLILLLSIASFMQQSLCCPCNLSTQDKRPFFEQYETEETDNNQKDNEQEELAESSQS